MKSSKKENLFIATIAAGALVAGVATGVDVQEAKAATPNPESDFTYTVSNGEVTITKYMGTKKDVVIPSTIGGKPVVKIGMDIDDYTKGPFFNANITSLEIPNSVNKIGDYAFYYNKLTNLVIPSSVTSIGEFSFSDSGIKSLILSNGLTTIKESAFANNSITNVVIPNSVTSIGPRAFQSNALTGVVIPSGVTSIGEFAFWGNNLTKVEIPSSIVSIGKNAFIGNANLADITYQGTGSSATFDTWGVSKSVIFKGYTGTSFESSVKAENLTFVSLGVPPNPVSDFTYTVNNGEITITGYVGTGKSIVFPSTINGMPVVKLGADVGDLENGSFQLKGLTSIVIPNTVREIGIRAFRGNSIPNLNIPSSVKIIGKMAFYETGLKTINLPEGLKEIHDNAFMNNYEEKTLVLPSTLETVGVSAFSQCGLTGTLNIPKSITNMGTEAFSRGSLTSVTFEDGLTTIGRWAFMGNLLTSISIPKS
ncbi:leucine-rich repeat domain-containing protein, partial [Streptomyces sp. NPDC051130]|uniref:leucine-rich repeat domain-containing protein n=1 Tax=Streptomyces sp. NPDC051130 TaxID=3157223 RepID=UPI00342FFF3B